MRTPPALLSALFGLAVLGVLVVVALLAALLGGPAALLGFLAVVALLLGLAVARLRRTAAAAAPVRARACTCCDGDHTRPVTVR